MAGGAAPLWEPGYRFSGIVVPYPTVFRWRRNPVRRLVRGGDSARVLSAYRGEPARSAGWDGAGTPARGGANA